MSEKKTWSIPPEPDETVTHVRDSIDRLWARRENDRWFLTTRPNMNGYSWYRLLTSLAPITDATGDDDE